MVSACAECYAKALESDHTGTLGTPATLISPSTLWLDRERIEITCPDLVDLQPITGEERNRWFGITADARLIELDLDLCIARELWQSKRTLPKHGLRLHVSRGGRFAAVVDARGLFGEVFDTAVGNVMFSLERANYHAEHCDFPIAFIERDGQTMVCVAPTWNRLDLHDPATGKLLTPRANPEYVANARPEHYLDYFHCGLVVSKDQRRIANNGWVWSPVGEVVTWSIDAWLANVWESEDGESRKLLVWRSYFWDGPIAWLDDTRLLIWGYGDDDETLVPAVLVYDTVTGTRERWFAGVPSGELVVDDLLYVIGERITGWDVERGARVLDAEANAHRYHPDARVFASLVEGGAIEIARVCGQYAEWNRGAVAELAPDPENLHVLGDALEAAGCTDRDVLDHCHANAVHGRHCWAFARLGRR